MLAVADRESTRQWGHKKSFVLYVCPTFVVVAATATAAAAAAAAAVVVVAGQLDICGPIFRFATSLLLLWIFPFPARSVTLLPLSVDPFALSRTAWHTRGQRNDGMGRDGTSEEDSEDSVNVSLCSLNSFSRSLFLFLLSPFSQHTHLSAFIILPSLFRTQPIASTRTHSTLILFLSLSLAILPSTLLFSLSGSVSFQCFPVPSGHCKAGGVCERRDTMLCLRTAGLTYFVC